MDNGDKLFFRVRLYFVFLVLFFPYLYQIHSYCLVKWECKGQSSQINSAAIEHRRCQKCHCPTCTLRTPVQSAQFTYPNCTSPALQTSVVVLTLVQSVLAVLTLVIAGAYGLSSFRYQHQLHISQRLCSMVKCERTEEDHAHERELYHK